MGDGEGRVNTDVFVVRSAKTIRTLRTYDYREDPSDQTISNRLTVSGKAYHRNSRRREHSRRSRSRRRLRKVPKVVQAERYPWRDGLRRSDQGLDGRLVACDRTQAEMQPWNLSDASREQNSTDGGSADQVLTTALRSAPPMPPSPWSTQPAR